MIIAGMGNSQTVLLTVALEQQPSGVQVVEGVGLVASGFQFFSCLAAVFAEEVGNLLLFVQSC